MTRMSEGVAEVDGGTISWEAAGEGAAVTFLHPGLWDRRTWDEQFGLFAKTYRVVRYDARGYGRSSLPEPGRPYSHVRDLVGVLNAAEVDRTALVGCSMGGGIEIDLALEHPELVTALVLAAPGLNGLEGSPEEEVVWDAWYEERRAPIEAAIEAGDLEAAQDLRLRTLWAPLGTEDPAGKRIREIALDNLQEFTMDESAAAALDPPAAWRLAEIMAPTLVLPADHDPPWHGRICEVLAEQIPNARSVQIPDTDHVINMRQPAEFNRVVLEFLGEVL
jgi:3-oxoadipate enol-lactonase